MINKTTERLLKVTKKIGIGETMKKSEFSKIDYYVHSDSVMMNLLMSAKVQGGLPSGRVSCLAGPKSQGKTQAAMNFAKKFQKDGGTIILVDAEFASEDKALENLGLDTSNIIYLPLTHITDDDKEMSITYNLNEILKEVTREDKVMVIIDSLGALQTKETLQNIEKNNTSDDMRIARTKKSFTSFITAITGHKSLVTLILNHSYESIGSFTGGQKVGGGGAMYFPSTVLLFSTKSQLKIDEEVQGTIIRTIVDKGRLSRERAVGKWVMHYEHGILPFYGLDEFALEGGYIEETKSGRSVVYMFKIGDKEYICPKKYYMLPEHNIFWQILLKETDFKEYLNDIFAYGSNKKSNVLEIKEKDK